VTFAGEVEGEKKRALFLAADLFVLPTYSESFGMAIAEALSYALPVLTTTGAPWPLLSREGCGWSVKPTVAELTTALQAATQLDAGTLRTMGARGREIVAGRFQWTAVAEQLLSLYANATASQPGW
jgi:glycosyltransferase involved in cell wall biosynthesis